MQRPLASMILIFVILVLSADHAYAWPKGSGIPLAQQPLGNEINQIDVTVLPDRNDPTVQFNALIGVTSCGIDADGDERDCEVEELLCSNWCSTDCGGGCESNYVGGGCIGSEVERDMAIAHCIDETPTTSDGDTCTPLYLDCDAGSYDIGTELCDENGELQRIACDDATNCVVIESTGASCDTSIPTNPGDGDDTTGDECITPEQCSQADASKPFCDDGSCVECISATNCPDVTGKQKLCTFNECKYYDCLVDDNCAGDTYCYWLTRTCQECTSDSHCDEGYGCTGTFSRSCTEIPPEEEEEDAGELPPDPNDPILA